jgi:hypothetical protein
MNTFQEYVDAPVVKNSNVIEKIGIPDTLRILKDGETPKKGQHIFRILTAKDGDKRVVWDSRDINQIEDAKAMFDECVAKGLVPYWVGTNGRATSEVMDEFDSECGEIIFLPISQVAGG